MLFEKAQNVLVERARIFEAASMAGAGNDVMLQAHWVLRYFTSNLSPPNVFIGGPVRVSPGFPIEVFGNDGLLEGLEIAFIT